jgi:transcription elongation factor Elf1
LVADIHKDKRVEEMKTKQSFSGYVFTTPKCGWCDKSDKMQLKTIWFKFLNKKHYITLWMCKRCGANNGGYTYG